MLPPQNTIIAIKPPLQPSPRPASPPLTTTTAQLRPIRTLNWKRFVLGPPTGSGGCRCCCCCVCLTTYFSFPSLYISLLLRVFRSFVFLWFVCLLLIFLPLVKTYSRQTTRQQSISGTAIRVSATEGRQHLSPPSSHTT